MTNFQRLQIIACLCTIANFGCNFFGINAEDIGKLLKPSGLVKTELIAQR